MVLHHIGCITEGNLAPGDTELLLSIVTNRYASLLNFQSKKTEPEIANLAMIPQMVIHTWLNMCNSFPALRLLCVLDCLVLTDIL